MTWRMYFYNFLMGCENESAMNCQFSTSQEKGQLCIFCPESKFDWSQSKKQGYLVHTMQAVPKLAAGWIAIAAKFAAAALTPALSPLPILLEGKNRGLYFRAIGDIGCRHLSSAHTSLLAGLKLGTRRATAACSAFLRQLPLSSHRNPWLYGA